MKSRYIQLALCVALGAGLGSCSKEAPFSDSTSAMGEFHKEWLQVEVSENTRADATRAAVPEADEFTIGFYPEGSQNPTEEYLYAEMPEVVTLPVGLYTIRASHGDNPSADWESPYYAGSGSVRITTDDITDLPEPIVCSLANIHVNIIFDESLTSVMSDDSKVTVKVGESGTLDFTAADALRSGYFAYVEGSSTLTATFSGTVQGYRSVETKALDNVQPGHHYTITFRLHKFEEIEEPGYIDGSLKVDASVSDKDINADVDPGEDTVVDDLRPVEGGGDDPTPPVGNPPVITAQTPVTLDGVNVVELNEDGESAYPVVLNITSETGIKTFDVVIDSGTLTPEALNGVGLAKNLDLVNPGEFAEGLSSIGLPVNVGGMKEVEFNITDFMPLLNILGPGTHKFILTVTDEGGSSTATLTLQTK